MSRELMLGSWKNSRPIDGCLNFTVVYLITRRDSGIDDKCWTYLVFSSVAGWVHQKWQKDLAPCKGDTNPKWLTVLRGMLVADIGWVADREQKTAYLHLEEKAVTACVKARTTVRALLTERRGLLRKPAEPGLETGMRDALPSLLFFFFFFLFLFPSLLQFPPERLILAECLE